MIPIGKMRDQVDILQLVVRQDESGGEVKTYRPDAATPFVWLKALSGRELAAARQVTAEVTHKIVGHFDELQHVTAEHRICDRETGREFDVEVVLPSDDRDAVEITAIYRPNG